MTAITCIEDLRLPAQKRVPRMFYDYADSGSWTESTDHKELDLTLAFCGRTRIEQVDRSILLPGIYPT